MTGPVTLIGSYPPPYGGVSVHIKRLRRGLRQRNIEVSVLADPGSGSREPGIEPRRLGPAWSVDRLLRGRRGVIHFHLSGLVSARLLGLSVIAALGRPVVLTVHSLRESIGGPHAAWPVILRPFQQIICVGPEVRDRLVGIGAPAARIRVIPSYLPPDLNDDDRRHIAPEVEAFLRDHHPILTASAYRLVFFKGEDLYGLDMCVELCRRLLPNHPELGFVFALPEIGDQDYYASMRAKITAAGLERHFCFSHTAGEYWPIVERSSLLVRPTNTDSYGVSVAEALDLGVPALASDVCRRAPGTVLFRNRDDDHLFELAGDMLANLDDYRRRVKGRGSGDDAIRLIMEVYDRVLEQAPADGAR